MNVDRATIIREPWLELTLIGRKTWEMRSRPTHHRGTIGLIRKGSGLIVGVAELVDCKPALSLKVLRASVRLHATAAREFDNPDVARYSTGWVLAKAKRLTKPIPYVHAGGVSWVRLPEDVAQAVARQARNG